MSQQELLKKTVLALEKRKIQYMVTGSIVSSLQGEPRASHDIDILVDLPLSMVEPLFLSFPPKDYYLSKEAMRSAVQARKMFNLIDMVEGDKVDFWILKKDDFDLSRFDRRYREPILDFKMYVSTPEDTILAKLKWSKLSGGSEKQYVDALRIYEVQGENLDISYLEDWAEKLHLVDLWNSIKDEGKQI